MERVIAVEKLHKLKGQDLRLLADKYDVTVWKDNKNFLPLTIVQSWQNSKRLKYKLYPSM